LARLLQLKKTLKVYDFKPINKIKGDFMITLMILSFLLVMGLMFYKINKNKMKGKCRGAPIQAIRKGSMK
jgi:hypothetical protein